MNKQEKEKIKQRLLSQYPFMSQMKEEDIDIFIESDDYKLIFNESIKNLRLEYSFIQDN